MPVLARWVARRRASLNRLQVNTYNCDSLVERYCIPDRRGGFNLIERWVGKGGGARTFRGGCED